MDGVKRILQAIADESDTLRQLRDSPDELGQKMGLSDDEVAALKKADIIIAARPKEITFITGSTIVV